MEYYDCVKDPIKNYFLEKMQNTLVSKEALIILMKSNNAEKGIINVSEKELEFDSLRSFDELYIQEKQHKHNSLKKNYPTELVDKMEKIEKYRSLKVSFNIIIYKGGKIIIFFVFKYLFIVFKLLLKEVGTFLIFKSSSYCLS